MTIGENAMTALSQDIANIANLLGDKARAAMLVSLMQGKAFTAGELALRANISAQTASNHLSKLMKAKLIICEPAGRHRYYKLATSQVAQAIEALGLLGDPHKQRPPGHNRLDKEICFARTCYDHLAGELGVKVTNALLTNKHITTKDKDYAITAKGKKFFKELSIDTDELKQLRRQFAKPCLDWTEREHHIAGSLGSALLDYFLLNRLVLRSKNKPRVVVLTTKGRSWLAQTLRVS